MALATADAAAAAAPAAPAPPASTAVAASAPAAKATLAAIVESGAEQDAFEAAITRHLPDAARVAALDAAVRADERAFAALDAPIAAHGSDLSERLVVFDRMSRLRELEGSIASSARQVTHWADSLDADLDRVARRDREAAGWLASAQARQAPAALVERLQALPARHAALIRQMLASRDRAVLLLDEIVVLRTRVEARLAELAARSAVIESRLRAAHGAPLWRVDDADDLRGALGFVGVELAEARAYLQAQAITLLAIGLGTLALTVLAMRSVPRRPLDDAAEPFMRRTRALFDRPWTASLAVALAATAVFAPRAPVLFYNLYWVALAVPAAILARHVLATDSRLALYTTAAVIASVAVLEPVVGPLPVAGRWLHIVQYLAVAAALLVDLRRRRLLGGRTMRPEVARRLTQALIAVLVLAALASAGGRVGAARMLGLGALGALGLWSVLVIFAHLVYGIGVGVLESGVARRLRIVAAHGVALRRALRRGLAGGVVIAWLAGMLALLGLAADLAATARSMLDSHLDIGAVTLSTASLVAGAAVLAGTWVLVKVAGPLLEIEILPRLVRRRGVAFALSALVRYALVTAGLLLALAAMGIDLTKVTVIAGALGVGIGFGLQSAVNNFLSGLILLFERPITAGDVVQIGDVQGEILGIGVRATTVRTPQGAEVIVPNADLVTKVVSNWTLSDGRRRLEIEIDAPVEGGPEAVQDLLETAARDVDGVSPSHRPRAWFGGARDGRYRFRLHVWIDDQERALAVQSALQLLIARRLEAAGLRAV